MAARLQAMAERNQGGGKGAPPAKHPPHLDKPLPPHLDNSSNSSSSSSSSSSSNSNSSSSSSSSNGGSRPPGDNNGKQICYAFKNGECTRGDRCKFLHEEEEDIEKEKPNFETTGKLQAEMNTVNGIEVNYQEPQDAAMPNRRWRLYQFKGETQLETINIHRQSNYIIGRERKIAGIPVDHPSCSKQHAVIQFRSRAVANEQGELSAHIHPYIIDLNSTNGTYIGGERIESARYYKLMEDDVLKFGFSAREYVLLAATDMKAINTLNDDDSDDTSYIQ